jgi:hypothetical protein
VRAPRALHTFTEQPVCSICLDPARPAPAGGGRDARRPGGARAHRQLSRPLLRADGPAQPARRHRPWRSVP